MAPYLDHLFVLTDAEDHALQPASQGFPIVRHGPHRGGGTGNVVYRLGAVLLELAYPIDPDEIAALGAIGFAERWRWRENGSSPFGIVVQMEQEQSQPFETWLYRPPFDPENAWKVIKADRSEPLYMVVPVSGSSLAASSRTVERVIVTAPQVAEWSTFAEQLASSRLVEFVYGASPLIEIHFASVELPSLDLRPSVPLVLRNCAENSVTRQPARGF